jgi:hypothetical protein
MPAQCRAAALPAQADQHAQRAGLGTGSRCHSRCIALHGPAWPAPALRS